MVVNTEEYSKQIAELQGNLKSAATRLRQQIDRSRKLEDAILAYVSEADRTGTMNPKNLRILREAIHK